MSRPHGTTWHVWRSVPDGGWIDVGQWHQRREADDHARRIRAAAEKHGTTTDAVVRPEGKQP